MAMEEAERDHKAAIQKHETAQSMVAQVPPVVPVPQDPLYPSTSVVTRAPSMTHRAREWVRAGAGC